MAVSVKLHKLEFAGPKQTAITQLACQRLETALNDPAFPQRVLTATYTARWRVMEKGPDQQIEPQQILDMIMGGREAGKRANGEIDLYIQFKPMMQGVLGSTTLGKFPIQTAYWFVNSCIADNDPDNLAAHFMHEWMHVAGFYHLGGNGARGDVAYVIGQIVLDLLGGQGDHHTSAPQ